MLRDIPALSDRASLVLSVYLSCLPWVCVSVVEQHDLSRSYPLLQPTESDRLAPGQLELVLSHQPGQLFLSRGCHSTELVLRCPADRVLVVVSAQFSPHTTHSHTRLNCSHNTAHSQAAEGVVLRPGERDRDIRQALNRRCSGYSRGEECRFSLLLDQAAAPSWGEGLVTVWHRCVANITTQCGRVRHTARGYLMSRAYPKYYLGGETCTYHLSVPHHQVLLLLVLDIQLPGLDSEGAQCGGTGLNIDHRAVVCGELGRQFHYVSSSSRAVLSYASHYVHPYRGWIVEIVGVGCDPDTTAPHTYLASHNHTHATYHCIAGYVFHTTLSPTTTLVCAGDTYHTPLPPCVSVTTLLSQANTSVITALLNTPPHHTHHYTWSQELFLPLFLTILTLVISISGLIILLFMKKHLSSSQGHPHSYKYHA